MSDTTRPPPGWYNDPTDSRFQRYWDGTGWTHHVAPLPSTAVVPARAEAPGQYRGAPQASSGNRTLTIVLVVVGIVVVLPVVIGIIAAVAIPVFLSQEQASEADAAARADAASLGQAISTFYVTSYGQHPIISVEDGMYVVEGKRGFSPFDPEPTRIEIPVSEGVEYGGRTGNSVQQWCVWVTAPEGKIKDYKSTTTVFAEAGRC